MNVSSFCRTVNAAVLAATLGLSLCAHGIDKETSLYKFSRTSGGYFPVGKLLMDISGNLYGTANAGGPSGGGSVFELSPASGGGYNYSVLYYFTGAEYGALGSLIMDSAGNLYGTVQYGSTGEIYELSPGISGTWTETSLYIFPSVDGPVSPVVMDVAGDLYGTSTSGGPSGTGFVFELSPSPGGWTLQDLYDFSIGADGWYPQDGVVLDSAGNLYGVTYYGGSSTSCSSGCGVVFELKKGSGSWTEKVIHVFNSSNGFGAQAPLVFDSSGNLYGSTTQGGKYGGGVIFELERTSSGWQAHPVHDFRGYPNDGAFPNSGLTIFNGNLYGTTESGGSTNGCEVGKDIGCGTAFELSPSGGAWKGTLLHSFTGLWDGALPQGLIFDTGGNALGVAQAGGTPSDAGVAFELTPIAK
jgi:uncharacterized repeat protein (TIGR03803 family)